MEDTLRVAARSGNQTYSGLNPCFNGRYSQSYLTIRLSLNVNMS